MNNLSIETRKIGNHEWSEILSKFYDANIYQTVPYGEEKWGKDNIGHILIKQDKKIIGAAQYTKKKIPLTFTTIIYIYRGPLWRRKDNTEEHHNLKNIINAVYTEFVKKNNFVVRILPNEYTPNKYDIDHFYLNNNFIINNQIQNSQSIVVHLAKNEESLLKTFTKKWRENLNRAKRYNMELIKGNDKKTMNRFVDLYSEMYNRKKFAEFLDINMFLKMQEKLNDDQKLSTMIARLDGEDIAGIVWSDMGDHGIPIFSATATKGLKFRGSYLLRWKIIEELKNKQILKLDQGGINKINNPGGYKFKSGMGGDEIKFNGPYDAFPSNYEKIVFYIIDQLRNFKKKIKLYLHKGKLS